jgi:DNA-binding NarL/FixJ family response regulator
MKNPKMTAEFQLIKLIKTLHNEQKTLSYIEFFSVLNSIKTIHNNKQFIENLIKSLKVLNQTKVYNKDNLTKREKQVFLMIGEGMKNTDIANRLKLSKSTIETHRKNIRKKLKLINSDNLFAVALIFNVQYQNGSE